MRSYLLCRTPAVILGALFVCITTLLAFTPTLAGQAGFSAHDVYLDKCAACHAQDGSGETVKGRKDKVKDIRQTIKKMSEDQMIEVVEKGKGAYMNSFSKQYSPEQIKALVEYYRSLASQ